MAPTVGQRFMHKYWTGPDGKPLAYQVTAIRNGVVYIRADGERKAKETVALERWTKVYRAAA
jgi:hypothetical protein